MKNKLFVCMSHTLNEDQKNGFIYQFGETEFIDMKDVNTELKEKCSNIPAMATLSELRKLAFDVVEIARENGCTHFFLTGEPTLSFWANSEANYGFYGDSMVCVQSTTERVSQDSVQPDGTVIKTQVFKHVQWREMF